MINVTQYTKVPVFAHWMPWFGTSGHAKFNYTLNNGVTIPYVSSAISICDDQCTNLVAAGYTGINVDFYGPESASAAACIRMLGACERVGLKYFICVDQGAISKSFTTQTDVTNEYIRILKITADIFCSSPFYLNDPSGNPIFNFFGEPSVGANWTTIRAGLPFKLSMVFQNFTHAECDGAFGWVNPVLPTDPTNLNLPAITSFISSAAANPTKLAFYPAYAGFDDSLASWGKKRVITQGVGKTLITTLGMIPTTAKYGLVATWNDWEEGSAVESSEKVVCAE